MPVSSEKIILLGHGENSIYQIDMELRNQYKDEIDIVPVIGDIQDRERMFEVMEEHKPDVVYHAAAHKHVPLMEYNPKEAVKTTFSGRKTSPKQRLRLVSERLCLSLQIKLSIRQM